MCPPVSAHTRFSVGPPKPASAPVSVMPSTALSAARNGTDSAAGSYAVHASESARASEGYSGEMIGVSIVPAPAACVVVSTSSVRSAPPRTRMRSL